MSRLTLGYPWEEPDARKTHVRICEGESRMAELLDQLMLSAMAFNLKKAAILAGG